MGYKNATAILPRSLLCAIQQYVDGEYIYIPRKEAKKLPWGANTETRETLMARNREIVAKRRMGESVSELSEQYFLSAKAIYKIISAAKNN